MHEIKDAFVQIWRHKAIKSIETRSACLDTRDAGEKQSVFFYWVWQPNELNYKAEKKEAGAARGSDTKPQLIITWRPPTGWMKNCQSFKNIARNKLHYDDNIYDMGWYASPCFSTFAQGPHV